MTERKLWVVEALDEDHPEKGWGATCFVGLTRDGAREAQSDFKQNEGFRSRIRLYVPAPHPEGDHGPTEEQGR